MHNFEYIRPAHIEAAIELMQTGATFFAGGTDILPLMKCDVKDVRILADLQDIPDLRGIHENKDNFILGAMTTLQEIVSNTSLQKRYPSVVHAARRVASPQIRNCGTLGGNLMQDRRCMYFNQSLEWRRSMDLCFKTGGNVCHQAPGSPVCRAPYYSDVATALVACGATATVWQGGSRKVISVEELCRIHGEINGTFQRDALLIENVILPLNAGWNRFLKVSVRESIDFPIFNAAASVKDTGSWPQICIAAGAVAPHPIVLQNTSELAGRALMAGQTEQVMEAALAEISKQAMLVRETGITMKTKRASFLRIKDLIEKMGLHLAQK